MASPTFSFFRILGNDVPGLHAAGQTAENLRFILKHEPPLEGCTKRFVLNRIADPARLELLEGLLAGYDVDVIPFEPEAYCRQSTPVLRGRYITNNNPARNRALELGLAASDYALPFDGQLFLPPRAWSEIRAAAAAFPACPAFVVPMTRLLSAEEALQDGRIDRNEFGGPSEPQILFSRACPDRFDESIPYGAGPKVEMLMRLGVPGVWDAYESPWWDAIRARPPSPCAGRCRAAGFVYRLPSGNPMATIQPENRWNVRREGVRELRERLDAQLGIPRT